ncbi:MAG: hypothetical protein IIC67_08840, partial [Thaumarchaeota archaeon]|nr:hypothetical protein [Nitrososphaerota archaeon]
MSNDEITLKDIHNDLRELLTWVKFSGIKEVKSILEVQLPNDSKKTIYHLSDSMKGTKEIAKIVGGISHMSIANYWKSWEKVGLGESVAAMGGKRFKRSFDMEDFGIKVPELPKQEFIEPLKITIKGIIIGANEAKNV